MAVTLYGHLFSRAHRVAWMLKELEIPFEHVPTNFLDGSTRDEKFLRINPNGRVPALVDGDLVLFESLAINLYLARRYGGDIAPGDLNEEALATQWSLWVATEIEKPMLLAAANSSLFPPGQRNAEEAEVALEKLQRPFAVLEEHLKREPWLMGSRFTVADLNVSAVMSLMLIVGISVDKWPVMKAWLTRCLERPAAADWKPIHFTIPRPPTTLGIIRMFV